MSEFTEYSAIGWKLCGIDSGKKAPTYAGWHENPLPVEALEGLDGAGLLHALSGTAALDIDDLALARPWLAARGVDIDSFMAAPTAVMISSGRHNRAKLLYAHPKNIRPLRTLKPTKSGIELRCATTDGKSVQDVLPPTIHPDTKKPYAWKYGDPLVAHWSALPPLPSALLALWRELLADIPPDRTPTSPRPDAEVADIRKAIYDHIAHNKVDITDYMEWLSIGARLHEQTGGAVDGLDIWDEWSATDKSIGKNGKPRYQGREDVELHYRSFKEGRPGNVGMTGMLAQLPAKADEFEVEGEAAAPEETTAELIKKQTAETKAKAIAKLEERLVFVYTAERYFDTQRRRVINTESALEHMFTHMMPKKKGGKKESPVQLLKESSTKRFVDRIGFHPGEDAIFRDREDYSYANTYDGSRIPAALEPTTEELEKIEWIFERIDDPTYRTWLRRFYAYAIQYPGAKIRSAPLIWSETQGNGKTTLVRMIPSLLVGAKYSQEVTTTQLEDGFTGFLADKWHLYLGEFRANNRAEREAIAKKVEKWIADDVITVRHMHQVAYDIPNHLFVTASSNYDDAASINNQDRKWAIHELKAPQFTEAEQEWIYTDFLLLPRAAGVLRYYFQHVDTTGFTPSAKAPHTEARQEMIAASVSSDLEAMTLALEERTGPFARDVVLGGEVMDWVRKAGNFKPSLHRIGRILARPPFSGDAIRFRVGESRYHGVVIRNKDRWLNAYGKDIMDHIQGVTDNDFEVEKDVDLLA